MLVGMKRWIAAALLAAGCYRSSPPPASPPPASPEPARPAFQEPAATYAHARSHPTRPAPERGLIAEAIAKLGELADDMCACSDRTCADAVSQEMTRWSSEMQMKMKGGDEKLEPTEEETQEAMKVGERLSKCMMTAMGHGASSPPAPPSP